MQVYINLNEEVTHLLLIPGFHAYFKNQLKNIVND